MRTILIITCAFLLTSCGGGSNENDSPDIREAILDATGGTPLDLPSDVIRDEFARQIQAADTLLASDFYSNGQAIAQTSCIGDVCSIGGAPVTLQNLQTVLAPITYESIMTKNGVHITHGTNKEARGAFLKVESGYGGWLDDNFFIVASENFEGTGLPPGVSENWSVSIGNATGSVPTASATWRGVVLATSLDNGEGHQGEAAISLDFAASNVDAAFTNMYDIETGDPRNSIMFDDLPLTADGFESRTNGRINGKFYGDNHAEVGGTFSQGRRVGAFGAERHE